MTIALKPPSPNPPILRPCFCGLLHSNDSSSQKMQVISIALVLLASLFATELAIGTWSHSLSLLADAGHLLADVTALSMTLGAAWLAQRPARDRATFGHQRVEILAALLNGLGLLAIAAFVTWESWERFNLPQTVLGLPMLLGAGIGLLVNSLNILLLYQRSQDDLNLKAAFLHVVADAASSVGVIIASLTIYFWHWMWMDTTASLMVAVLTSLSALPLIKQSLEILLEYAPTSIDPTEIEATLLAFESVQQVEALWIWSISANQIALVAQIRVAKSLGSGERDRLLQKLQTHLQRIYQIEEIVLQLKSDELQVKTSLHPLLHQSLTEHVSRKTRSSLS
ncbi:cation diffusion facilitator family transporter [Phormidesmis priestleyi]